MSLNTARNPAVLLQPPNSPILIAGHFKPPLPSKNPSHTPTSTSPSADVPFLLHKEDRSQQVALSYLPIPKSYPCLPFIFFLSYCESGGTLFCFRQSLHSCFGTHPTHLPRNLTPLVVPLLSPASLELLNLFKSLLLTR